MRRSIFGCLALFVLFVFQAKKVGADPTEAKVAYTEGKRAYQAYDYTTAIQALIRSTQGRCRFLPSALCRDALRFLALSYYNDGKRGPAAATWVALLRRDPAAKLPSDQSPAVYAFFAAIKLKASPPPRLPPSLPPPRYIPPPRRLPPLLLSLRIPLKDLRKTASVPPPLSVPAPSFWTLYGLPVALAGGAVLFGVAGLTTGVLFVQQNGVWETSWREKRNRAWNEGTPQTSLMQSLQNDPHYQSAQISGLLTIIFLSTAGVALSTGLVFFLLQERWIRAAPRHKLPPEPSEPPYEKQPPPVNLFSSSP